MCVPAHISRLSKEQLMSLFLLTTTSSDILTTLTSRKGGESPHSLARESSSSRLQGNSASLTGEEASRVGEGSPAPAVLMAPSVRTLLQWQDRGVLSLKQHLSVFLPHHLLNQSTLPQQLDKLHNSRKTFL